jgi:hypothetical protein
LAIELLLGDVELRAVARFLEFAGAHHRDRTDDLVLTKDVLYRLS